MKHVVRIIHKVSEIVTTIASAVGEQSLTGNEIAENVDQSAGEIAESSNHIRVSSRELSLLTESLTRLVAKFKI